MGMKELITELKNKGALTTKEVERALRRIDRADFVPSDLEAFAYDDTALPIRGGQTISQPYTVVCILELLEVERGNNILEIGYGSGWQTALLAELLRQSGHVYAFEIVEELCETGSRNLKKYPELFSRVDLFCKSGRDGLLRHAPFDRIIVAAEVTEVPIAWREQLSIGGRMVYPKNGAIVLEVKEGAENFLVSNFPGFAFVPFIG